MTKKIVAIEKDNKIYFVPVNGIKKMRGFVKGISSKDLRDESERFS